MNKLFILSVLAALSVQPSFAAPVATVLAPAVTVTADGSIRTALQSAAARKRAAKASAAPVASKSSSTPASTSSSSGSSSSSTSGSTPSSGSGKLDITQDQFMKAWANGKQYLLDPNITPPTAAQYKAFIENAASKGGIESKTELAMFLAEIMWESGGLIYKSELACKDNNCAGSYQDSDGLPGKFYYGRGYIQLTWGRNYKAASRDLFNDDRLLQNPDEVATNEEYAWDVSFWFWKAHVKPALKGTYNFGLATKEINGPIECNGGNDRPKKRFLIYTEILKVFEPSATPIETGCYN